MAPLIPIALQLAQFAPMLMRFFGADETSAGVAEKVVDIATTITGAKTPEEALANMQQSVQYQHEFRLKVLESKADLEHAYLKDVQDARKRDTAIRLAGHINYRANLLTLGAFVVVALICWQVWSMPNVNDYVKGVATLVLGRFLGYMDQIFQFEFGTTRHTQELGKNANGS